MQAARYLPPSPSHLQACFACLNLEQLGHLDALRGAVGTECTQLGVQLLVLLRAWGGKQR